MKTDKEIVAISAHIREGLLDSMHVDSKSPDHPLILKAPSQRIRCCSQHILESVSRGNGSVLKDLDPMPSSFMPLSVLSHISPPAPQRASFALREIPVMVPCPQLMRSCRCHLRIKVNIRNLCKQAHNGKYGWRLALSSLKCASDMA